MFIFIIICQQTIPVAIYYSLGGVYRFAFSNSFHRYLVVVFFSYSIKEAPENSVTFWVMMMMVAEAHNSMVCSVHSLCGKYAPVCIRGAHCSIVLVGWHYEMKCTTEMP